MKKKYYLIGVAILLGGILCLFLRGGHGKKAMTGDNLPVETKGSTRKPFSLSAVISSIGLDPEEREIERDPHMSRQEKDEQRKWYRVHRDGADIKLTFHVTDSMGQDVPDATVEAGFFKNDDRKGETDENGLFTAEGKTWGELTCFVKKDGHYDTRVVCHFDSEDDDVKNGKWVPLHRTIEVTLKEKRNPIPMYVKQIGIRVPKKGEAVGVDLKVGDLVSPHGKGEYAHIMLKCWGDKPIPLTLAVSRYLTLSLDNEGEGFIRGGKDLQSAFYSLHEAPENGYEQAISFCYRRTNDKVLEEGELPKSEYLIFRTQVEPGKDGEIEKAHYGKIYSMWFDISANDREGAAISLTYYLNPTPNDRNLEFDPDKNLFEERKRGGVVLTP